MKKPLEKMILAGLWREMMSTKLWQFRKRRRLIREYRRKLGLYMVRHGEVLEYVERDLCALAERSDSDEVAKAAMRRLRREYDGSYGWCRECDGLVVKEDHCCLNWIDTGEDVSFE